MCPSVTCFGLVLGLKGRSVKSYTAFLRMSNPYAIYLLKTLPMIMSDIAALGISDIEPVDLLEIITSIC